MKKNIIHTIFSVILFLFFIGCAGGNYHLVIEDYYQPLTTDDTIKSNVTFTAEVIPRGGTKNVSRGAYTPDTIPLPENRVIHIYIYDGEYTPITGTPINFVIYSSTSAGIVAPTSAQYDINLDPGTYNFYALTELNHDSDKTPPFLYSDGTDGLKYMLSDNLDYLWWGYEGIVISDNESTNVNMQFQHICTQIQVTFIAASGHTITSISTPNIQYPSNTDIYLQMANGSITTSYTLASGMMNLDSIPGSNTFYIDLIPFEPPDNTMIMKVPLNLDNKGISWYDVNLPIPTEGVYEQGYCYMYDIYFGETTRATLTNSLIY